VEADCGFLPGTVERHAAGAVLYQAESEDYAVD
jgi:hypothetical protein